MNGLVKLLGGTYAPEQIVWARILSHLVFVLMIFLPTIGFAVFRTNRPGSQFVRSMMQLMSTSMFFFGVQFIPLADAAAISFMGPFIVTLMAVPMLGERISTIRLVAVLAGFFGVLIVIRPGTEVFQWHSMLIVEAAGLRRGARALHPLRVHLVQRRDALEVTFEERGRSIGVRSSELDQRGDVVREVRHARSHNAVTSASGRGSPFPGRRVLSV